ncbi:MAG: GxxExxY protein [Candidatus Nanoarchaeia archaeon]|nr:GxxExxY protein [Candidatus Nanoarchaeia archaeon]
MNQKQLKTMALKIKGIAEEVRKHLGCGFQENIFQGALAIEFRKNKVEYLKEVNIEIFYKGESVGADRPDFIITKIGDTKETIILELKVADKITDNHRSQLKSYCTSFPLNKNPLLSNFIGGILITFPACDIDSCSNIKLFVVDSKFNVIIDEQAEEDNRIFLEKEKQKKKQK